MPNNRVSTPKNVADLTQDLVNGLVIGVLADAENCALAKYQAIGPELNYYVTLKQLEAICKKWREISEVKP